MKSNHILRDTLLVGLALFIFMDIFVGILKAALIFAACLAIPVLYRKLRSHFRGLLREKTPEKVKRVIWWAVQRRPFGNLCKFKYGALDVSVTNKLWVITSDGQSKDALPLSFVSRELIERVAAELESKWYMPSLK